MRKIEKSEIYGAVSAIVAGILVILILMLFGLSFLRPLQEESSIRFGDSDSGGSSGGSREFFEPTPTSALEPAVAPPPTPAVASANPLQTQDFEESIEAREARKKEQERQREEQRQLQEQRALERAEQQRLEAERRAEEARIAEQKRIEAEKAAQAAAIRNRTTGALSGGGGGTGGGVGSGSGTGSGSGSGTGSGDGTGAGNQGNPFGTGTSGRGAVAKVGTRSVLATLVKPTDNVPVEGIIVVDIVVDEAGNVIEASIGSGTNIADSKVRNAALEAAKKTKFTKGTKAEMGTITYRYTLN